MVQCLEKLGVEYTISVPFERFVLLKERIEKRILWWQVPGSGGSSQYFESRWKPQSWAKKSRFIFIRNSVAVQNKGAIQLWRRLLKRRQIMERETLRGHVGVSNGQGQ